MSKVESSSSYPGIFRKIIRSPSPQQAKTTKKDYRKKHYPYKSQSGRFVSSPSEGTRRKCGSETRCFQCGTRIVENDIVLSICSHSSSVDHLNSFELIDTKSPKPSEDIPCFFTYGNFCSSRCRTHYIMKSNIVPYNIQAIDSTTLLDIKCHNHSWNGDVILHRKAHLKTEWTPMHIYFENIAFRFCAENNDMAHELQEYDILSSIFFDRLKWRSQWRLFASISQYQHHHQECSNCLQPFHWKSFPMINHKKISNDSFYKDFYKHNSNTSTRMSDHEVTYYVNFIDMYVSKKPVDELTYELGLYEIDHALKFCDPSCWKRYVINNNMYDNTTLRHGHNFCKMIGLSHVIASPPKEAHCEFSGDLEGLTTEDFRAAPYRFRLYDILLYPYEPTLPLVNLTKKSRLAEDIIDYVWKKKKTFASVNDVKLLIQQFLRERRNNDNGALEPTFNNSMLRQN